MDNGNRLYICGTNAHNPKDYVIYVSFLVFVSFVRFFPFSFPNKEIFSLKVPKELFNKKYFPPLTSTIYFLSQVVINQNYETRERV